MGALWGCILQRQVHPVGRCENKLEKVWCLPVRMQRPLENRMFWVLRKPILGLSSQLSSHNTSGNSFTSPSFSCLWNRNDSFYPEGFEAWIRQSWGSAVQWVRAPAWCPRPQCRSHLCPFLTVIWHSFSSVCKVGRTVVLSSRPLRKACNRNCYCYYDYYFVLFFRLFVCSGVFIAMHGLS